MLDVSSLKPGQVLLFGADFSSRSSLALATALKSEFTHAALFVGEGKVLNTYPGTDAVVIPVETLLNGREVLVLDRTATEDDRWRDEVTREAWGLVGSEYWLSPCSRLTALAFLRAGVPLLKDEPSWLNSQGWLLPEDLLTRTTLSTVHS